ncbi:MAG: protein-export chaperone SecB [Chromatiales bacterium]|nr:protein-export chaperone SecB [Chromatiales bacterium]
MTNQSGNGGAQPAQAGNGSIARQFILHRLYLKDLSFEVPGDVLQASSNPDIKLNLKTTHRDLGNEQTEVVLHVSAHAKQGEGTLFLIEVDQAGVFQISGCSPEESRMLVGIACPATLFPYAREVISSLVSRGGFPPLVLQHIDFAALFAQASAQQQQQEQGANPADAG